MTEKQEKQIGVIIVGILAIIIFIGMILDPTIFNACDPYGNCY